MPSFFYTSQIEELVSHGYIVASIEHTYENGAVVFPDGRVITNSLKSVSHFGAPPPGTSKEDWQKQLHLWEQQRVDVWAGDIQFVLDQLKRLDEDQTQEAPFRRRIDFSRVGAFGHSIGAMRWRVHANSIYESRLARMRMLDNNYWTMNGPRNGLCRRTAAAST